MTNTQLKSNIAGHLLKINAVVLKPDEPFTWSSGLKSPIYCDNRLTLSYPRVRAAIADGMVALIQEHYPDADVIAGTATAGIPHAAWVSERLDLPMAYIRGSAKSHGKKKRIEGLIEAGQKVVIVEDLISTGGSVLSAAEAIREEGAEVLGAVAIFTYGLETATVNFKEAQVPFVTLTDFQELAQQAKENGQLTDAQLQKLSIWHQNPQSDAWMK
ncbi:orotate phosphoribosyltransferase [Pullulanibacillus sp. KACC 23026]|uniref:orotate phosphoribosyltransferase n=1 Tax=Pullulanibacillus sp. KACC 23026 TaxID=3028315 RepID=UPI0023B1D4D5|nr:orotate phosphoribosyltransferase [Pullulanibacillus sp. KACC 23026]WEG11636.1 orotate phosphoribosyltransferase [Pullulanibacillus sp. KACC 23026]